MLTRVAWVGIACRDPGLALRFYRDTLDLGAEDIPDGSALLPVGGSAVRIMGPGFSADVDRFLEAGEGVHHLAFEGSLAGTPAGQFLDRRQHLGLGIMVAGPAAGAAPARAPWRGHVICIDHVVIASNDSARTAAHFRERLGIDIRRTMTRPGTSAHLEFAKLDDVILEFAGPPEPRPGPLDARYWGMVFAVDNIGAVLERVGRAGYPASDPRPAVQPGALIASVKSGTGGVPFALIQYNAR